MKRLFIGVKFSDDVNDYFQTSQLMVEKYCERANYTRYDNFHLTLRFLGMIEESKVPEIVQIIKDLEVQRMKLFFDHIGFFNKKGRYVIYMGCQPAVELTDYVMKLNDKLVKHLTIRNYYEEVVDYESYIAERGETADFATDFYIDTERYYYMVYGLKYGVEAFEELMEGKVFESVFDPAYKEYMMQIHPDWFDENGKLIMQDTTNIQNLLTQNIPLAPDSDTKYPADKLLLNDHILSVYGFNEDVDGSGKVTALDALLYTDANGEYLYYLVVEPLAYMNIYLGYNEDGTKIYEAKRSLGTYYNFIEYLASMGKNECYGLTYKRYYEDYGKNCLIVAKDRSEMKNPVQIATDSSRMTIQQVHKEMKDNNVGYAMHIYCAEDFKPMLNTSTYDEDKCGTNPGQAPDDIPAEDKALSPSEYEEKYKEKTANIVKFYENDTGDTIIRDSYTRTPTPRKIKIENEVPTGYVIKDWYTSQTFRSASGDDKIYNDYKDSMTNVQHGTSEKSITLGDNETTLYVLLVKEEAEDVEVETEYIIHESEISKPLRTNDEFRALEFSMTLGSLKDACTGHCNHPSDCNSCGTVPTCVHPSWCNDCGSEPTCDHDYSDNCGGTDSKGNPLGCVHPSGCNSCSSEPVCDHPSNCNSCGTKPACVHPDNCQGIEGDCMVRCTFNLVDSSVKIKLKNVKLNSYPKVLYTIGDNFTHRMSEVNLTRASVDSGNLKASGFDYSFVAYRGNDLLNYAEYKNNINNFGFSSLTDKTSKTRKTANYVEEVILEFMDNGSETTTTSKGDRNCTDTDTIDLNNRYLNHKIEIQIETYSGLLRTADRSINTNPRMTIGSSGANKWMGRMISTNTSVKFNPYIQMTWAGMDNAKHNVAVLSEYRREILPNDYAEISWVQSDGNLLVQSQMWATDASMTSVADSYAWTGLNQVLKGGATLQLTDKAVQSVMLSTYQTIIEDEARDISEITGTYQLTAAEADTYHRQFVDEAKETFDNAEIVQYVSTDNDGTAAWVNGTKVSRGGSIASLNNGSASASTEDKYYLDTDINNTSNAQRSDLDVAEVSTSKIRYRFFSDVEGNIWMEKNGSTSKILTKTQGVDSLSGEAANINNRTFAVTKLLAAIERNTGNDRTASWATSDGTWYNEAYAGITVYVQHTKLSIGITNGINKTRIMVLDPKLIPQVSSKSQQGTTAFSSAFKTSLTTNSAIASFKGASIFMNDADMLFNSRNIYIVNMTVDDSK